VAVDLYARRLFSTVRKAYRCATLRTHSPTRRAATLEVVCEPTLSGLVIFLIGLHGGCSEAKQYRSCRAPLAH
jgi:hypothetical protein